MLCKKVFGLILLFATTTICTKYDEPELNETSKDMYVVRATVYQVGILTNQTNETAEPNSCHEESITFYHNNGSTIDLSAIPAPLLTNVTAEKVIGVVPVTNHSVPWTALKHLVSMNHLQGNSSRPARLYYDIEQRGTGIKENISKREATGKQMEVLKGAAIIPLEAGVQSIALPPLLTLNKNLSKIPVPIPNMSVVSFAKVNTLVHSP